MRSRPADGALRAPAPARLAPALAALAALSACAADDASAASERSTSIRVVWPFAEPAGALPEGWRVATANAAEGAGDPVFEVRADPGAPSPPSSLQLVDAPGGIGQAYHLAWTPDVQLRDLELEVRVRAGGGDEDRGGGPAWRIAGPGDYYVARWNPLEDNFRVYVVRGGRRVELDSADVDVDDGAWHTIRVRHLGSAITCALDGEELLAVEDDALTAPGGIGVWTKADATSAFDDLVLDPIP